MFKFLFQNPTNVLNFNVHLKFKYSNKTIQMFKFSSKNPTNVLNRE